MKTLIAIFLSLLLPCYLQAKGLTRVFTEDQWTNPNYISVPNGLVGYWPFNEGVGSTTADLSGFGATGTLTGCSWGTSTNAESLYFDGVDDRVTIVNQTWYSFGTETSFGFGGWKYTNAYKGNYDTCFSNCDTGLSSSIGFLLIAGNSSYYCSVRQGTGTAALTTFTSTPSSYLGRWVCLFAVVDRNTQTLKAYLNGNLVETKSLSIGAGSVITTNNLLFGKSSVGSSNYLKGFLDNIRIYNRALSAAEVQTLYYLKQ